MIAFAPQLVRNAWEDCRWLLDQATSPQLRGMRAWAEEEVFLPNGPHEGRRWSASFQPFAGVLLDEIDSERWQRIVIKGPSQSGKTLTGFVIPVLYHLFEVQETVIVGVPDMDMAADKWAEDILPVIESTQYREFLPKRGRTSKGGFGGRSIRFTNGATLRFMSFGGNDKGRAGFTARVLCVTEANAGDVVGGGSAEAEKIKQLDARTRAYGSRRRHYYECTPTTKEGFVSREARDGSNSRIMMPCPHCREFVHLGREQLIGWRDAATVVEARERAAWQCPACNAAWTDEQRQASAAASVLVHEGQEVDRRGAVTGEAKRTDTLGFSWSAPDNLFVAAADVAADEWRALRSEDPDTAEKEICQFVWGIDYVPPDSGHLALDPYRISQRTNNVPRGHVPAGTIALTLGIDLGKRLGHWVLVAWRENAGGTICDYGVFDVQSDALGIGPALLTALREFRDTVVMPGWPDPDGVARSPDTVFIDANWQGDGDLHPVYDFLLETGEPWYGTQGHGAGPESGRVYGAPRELSDHVARIGEHYHIVRHRFQNGRPRVRLVHVDVDYWKSWGQQRLTCETSHPGSVLLCAATDRYEHLKFGQHMSAERPTEVFKPKVGSVRVWERVRRQNHWLDSWTLACAAGHLAGVRLTQPGDRVPGVIGPTRTRKINYRQWRSGLRPGGRA